jgi:multidrug resistance efflux pump
MSEARETIAVPKPVPPTNKPTLPADNAQASLSDRVRSLRLVKPSGSAAKPRSAWLPWGLTAIALATAAAFGWRAYRLAPAGSNQTVEQSDGETGDAVKANGGPSSTAAASGTAASTAMSTATSSAASPTATAATGDVVLDSKGYLIAAHQIQLSPQVGGEIIWLDPNFKEGAVYKKGDRLAEIDPVLFAAQLDSANAALRVAQTNLTQVETGSTLQDIEAAKDLLENLAAKLELSKIDERYFKAAGFAITQHDKDKAAAQVKVDQSAYEGQKATLLKLQTSLEEQRAVAKAQVLSAQAGVQQAEKQLKNCTIVAPTSGIILSKKAELGGYVNPLAFGAAGYLCEMADLHDLEVELDIQERDISRVTPGQHCRIMPEAGQHDDAFLKTHPNGYDGVVSRRMPVANRAKGAVTVRVRVEIPEHEPSGEYLLPDMGVLVSFLK